MKRLLLLGGGHAHVHVLKSLAAEPLADTEVTLISPYEHQTYSGMLSGWVAGHYELEDCLIPLKPLTSAANIRFHRTAATRIDADPARVHCADGSELDYDWLSIDTGTAFDPEAVPGAAEHAMLVRPIENFIMQWRAARSRLADMPGADVVMVGGGAAGIELLLGMQHALPRCRFTLVSAANTLPGSAGQRLARILNARGIHLHGNTSAQRIFADRVMLENGQVIPSACTAVAIGATGGFLIPAPALARDERGFILTNDFLQSSSHPRIFAVGDCATMANHPRPKSGVYAVRAGPPLIANIRNALAAHPLEAYVPQRKALYLISTGNRHAVGSWGNWSWQGDWVWRWKDYIDRAFVAQYAL
jgi:pyridine nucleotide-disulfide oxidoreductase family protein